MRIVSIQVIEQPTTGTGAVQPHGAAHLDELPFGQCPFTPFVPGREGRLDPLPQFDEPHQTVELLRVHTPVIVLVDRMDPLHHY